MFQHAKTGLHTSSETAVHTCQVHTQNKPTCQGLQKCRLNTIEEWYLGQRRAVKFSSHFDGEGSWKRADVLHQIGSRVAVGLQKVVVFLQERDKLCSLLIKRVKLKKSRCEYCDPPMCTSRCRRACTRAWTRLDTFKYLMESCISSAFC